MSAIFLYEDGPGKIYDQSGNDAMDVEEWSKTDMSFLENCVFIDESGFDINMRPPGG